MEKLQLGRKWKTDAEKPRMDPLMRALKALHSAGSPEAMTPEELAYLGCWVWLTLAVRN